MSKKEPLAFVGLACGRQYLKVGGVIVAMEGDVCRDATIPAECCERRVDTIALDSLTNGRVMDEERFESIKRMCTRDVWNAKSMEWTAKQINSK